MTEDATKKLQDVADDIQNKLEESALSKEVQNNEGNGNSAPDAPPEDEAKNPFGEQDAFGKAFNSDEEPKCAFSAIGSENEENFSSKNDISNPQAEDEPDAHEEELSLAAKLTPYETLLNQVSQILPLVENMLINKEDAAKFSKEVALFNSIKAMSASLPAELKEDFMTGRMRVLLDFIIAKLSGKPGLLRTTVSLKKSGIFGKEEESLTDAEQQAQNYSEKELVKKVLSDMRMMTMSLHDRELAVGLEKLGKEAEEKL
jgi:hypothetical protein